MRLDAPTGDDSASPSPKPIRPIAFDTAEQAWQVYRQKGCQSVASQWDGSQTGVAYEDCLLKTTLSHMNELAELYSDLWH